MNNSALILVVDDEESIRTSLSKIFQKAGYRVNCAEDGLSALEIMALETPDLVLTDLSMPNMGGMELLKEIHDRYPASRVIMMTAYGTNDIAAEAMKNGAADFINKPLQRPEVLKAVSMALERQELIKENTQLKAQINNNTDKQVIVSSPSMQKILKMIEQAAKTSVTILLTGESGTGKEVMAKLIHDHSACANGPWQAINCAALPENLLESELFGHEKGAFTNAHDRHLGYFERANGGTLFLDEVGEMNHSLQVRLLRVLQDGTFERVGGSKPVTVSTRIIAATNVDLEKSVAEGKFREDLYYRLNVIPIHLPPLRERIEDIAPLVRHFISLYAKRHNTMVSTISPEALLALEKFPWPGNVRELGNTIERATVLCQDTTIQLNDLPSNIRDIAETNQSTKINKDNEFSFTWGLTVNEVQDLMIAEALKRCKGDKKEAATILGINARTVYRWLEKHPMPPFN